MITLSLDGEAPARSASLRILLLDSSAPASAFAGGLRILEARPDLLIFDTTCFASGSGRVRQVLRRAGGLGVPVVLVRSHTKLDSLGAEYGRLGSVAFVGWAKDRGSWLKEIPVETRNAVRLLGGAALPAHFPPYIGAPLYRALTGKRIAAMLRNSRSASRYFAAALPELAAELHYVHGLYVTLSAQQPLGEATARQAAADMSGDLAKAGLPIQHAGSFGFDFAATEWFHHSTTDRYSVRVAVPDLPTKIWDELVVAIAQWWSAHQRRGTRVPRKASV